MNKLTRSLSLLMVFALCLSLCGCNALDELRRSRATRPQEGVIRLADGTEYKLLPECEALCPTWDDMMYSYYIVEEDLPLLLTQYGDGVSSSKDGLFLEVYGEDIQYYCRTDAYDSIVARIDQGFTPDVYGYTYFDPEAGDYGDYVLCELTPAQAEAVEQVYATVQPEKLPVGARLDYEEKVDLYLYSADRLFRQDTVDICVVEGEYFLLTNDQMIYAVPGELTTVFANILLQS